MSAHAPNETIADSAPAPPANGLVARGVRVEFPRRDGTPVVALAEADLHLARGKVCAVVGESGSGKTTLARALVGLVPLAAGEVTIDGRAFPKKRRVEERRAIAEQVSMVFQDPRSSLNPRLSVLQAVIDPLIVHQRGTSAERKTRGMDLLADVGLPARVARRRVRDLSGGQLQRVAIARALTLEPNYIVADEPTSALDVSVQAQILNLIRELKDAKGFGVLLVTHDMRVVRSVSDSMIVMSEGRVVEHGATDEVFASPQTSYTRELIAATPLLSIGEQG
ncbi:UNVERIFIED_CONTAM: dipeptide/oligopeptide/nickel ABC transporter ATP-binding protein [Microbacterium sp. SLM126]